MADVAERLDQAIRLHQGGKVAQAKALIARALERTPADPALCNAMSLILFGEGRDAQAEYYARRGLASSPDDPALLTNLGNATAMQGQVEVAEEIFRRVLAGHPGFVEARMGLVNVVRNQLRYAEAAEEAARAMAHAPDDPGLAAILTSLLMILSRVPEAVTVAREALSRRADPMLASMHASAMTYMHGAMPEEVAEAHRLFGRLLEAATPASPAAFANEPDPERRLRVGLMSHELRTHSVAMFLEPLLTHYERGRLHVTCYSTSAKRDRVTERLRSMADGWVEAAGMDDAALAARIRRDGIDVLLETTGLTEGWRLGAVARRAAPVQATYLGYVNSTGVGAMDYRIADAITEPAENEHLSVERIVRLEPTYLCCRFDGEAPDPGEPPSRRAGVVTFGSFNSSRKLNDKVIALWARALDAVPGSRLLLKATELADRGVRERLATRLAAAGMPEGRFEIEGPTLGRSAFLERYRALDVALDPAPFNGTTTTIDCLLMGVPVVTLAGRMHAGRTGVDILTNVGYNEWIARDEDEYLAIAARLAGDEEGRAVLRGSLRHRWRIGPVRWARACAPDGGGDPGDVEGLVRAGDEQLTTNN